MISLPAPRKVLMNFRNVIQKLEQEKNRLEDAIAALRKLSNGASGASRSGMAHRNGGHARHSSGQSSVRASGHRSARSSRLSPAGRKKIAEAQRARWARQRQRKA
jgi:hypothetical protein